MAEKTPEYQRQQELRDQRRRRKSKPAEKLNRQVSTPITLYLVLRKDAEADLQRAYTALKDEELCTFFKKYKYHDARQAAVMRRNVVLEGVPFFLAQRLLSRLAKNGGWQQGSPQVNNE